LDYHAGGDLNAAMGFHVLNWSKEKNHVNEEKFIPEGFVWYTIRALATACLVLQNGTTSDIPINDWRSITHLDLRLPNVLLDVYTPPTRDDQEISEAESSNNARDAARAKEPVMPILADFGVSFFSPKSDGCPISDNPDDYVTAVDTRYPPVSVLARGCCPVRWLTTPRKCTNKPSRTLYDWAKRLTFGVLAILHGH
jgi:hypothetical protein